MRSLRNGAPCGIALLFVSLWTGFSAQSQTAEEWRKIGKNAWNEKKPVEAEKAYRAAVKADPYSDKALYDLGWLLNDLRRYTDAENVFADVVAKQGKLSADNYKEYGYALYKQNRYDDAIVQYKNANRDIIPDPVALRMLGQCADGKNDRNLAKYYYQQAVKYRPSYYSAWYDLGYLYNAEGKYDSAITALNAAAKNKQTREVYNELGFAFYKLKNAAVALMYYDSSLVIEPKQSTAYKGKGDVYRVVYSPANGEKAMQAYQTAISYYPEGQGAGAWYGLGWSYNSLSRFDEAMVALDKAMLLEPDLKLAYVEYGYALYKKGRYEQAEQRLLKAKSMSGAVSGPGLYYLGLVQFELGKRSDFNNTITLLETVNPKYADMLRKKWN